MRSKISVIGAGMVGASCAQQLAQRDYADVVLMDIIEGMPQGKALDLFQSTSILNTDTHLVGSNDYQDIADSEIVVVTSGVPRRPGMSRDELVLTNKEIVAGVTEEIVRYSPNCTILVVTNPLDAMAQLAFHVSKFPRNRVLGMSGILDTARFRAFLAEELDVSVEDVYACVLGGHGDTMVPLPRLTTVGGIPITQLLSQENIDRVVERTVKGGGEIVSLLRSGSAYYTPGAAVVQMIDAIILDKKRILPCSVYLQGEYGIEGVFLGVPVKLARRGVEQIIEIKLTSEEEAKLRKSAEAVRELVEVMKLE